MAIVEGVRINEAEYHLKDGSKAKIAIFMYAGDDDPAPILRKSIRIYTDGNKYYEFMDSNMDCPWVRMVMSNIDDMKQEDFSDYMFIKNRKDKLKKLNNVNNH